MKLYARVIERRERKENRKEKEKREIGVLLITLNEDEKWEREKMNEGEKKTRREALAIYMFERGIRRLAYQVFFDSLYNVITMILALIFNSQLLYFQFLKILFVFKFGGNNNCHLLLRKIRELFFIY